MNSENNECIEFWAVRHGETAENERNVIQGQGTGTMTKHGMRQMMLAAEKLYRVPFDAIYSSDLPRALESAQIIQAAGHRKLEIHPLEGLREWHLGVLEGLTREECLQRYPEVWQGVCQSSVNVLIPGGESRLELLKRVHDCLEELVACHPDTGRRILLVTHGGPLRMILRMIVGELRDGNHDGAIDNGSISRFNYYPATKSWQLVAWNNTEHLI
ncbi:MAG: histidine phosphatase family protein [Victivallales bacterium]|nr:histidine phosphatase family protein [Victivallales bacterium]